MSPNTSGPLMVNVGCGRTFHRDWLNFDLVSCAPEVRACDLRRGIPLPDSSCAAVYSSHVLEHLTREDGAAMLRECYRVLDRGGIVRIVVPDLEKIARDYVMCMDKGAESDPFLHRWLTIELYDQTTRTCGGGEMLRMFQQANDAEFTRIEQRLGEEARRTRNPPARSRKFGLVELVTKLLRRIHRTILEALVLGLGGKGARDALREGWFRRSGEIHLQMYDRFSLSQALKAAGFVDCHVRGPDQSAIPNFTTFALDSFNGAPRKPDSLIVEARKPAVAE